MIFICENCKKEQTNIDHPKPCECGGRTFTISDDKEDKKERKKNQ